MLSGEFATAPQEEAPTDDDALLAALGVKADDPDAPTTLKHVKPRAVADEIANLKRDGASQNRTPGRCSKSRPIRRGRKAARSMFCGASHAILRSPSVGRSSTKSA
jgi:hypothetical protein